jgi:soluble lytic murein transglycosylase
MLKPTRSVFAGLTLAFVATSACGETLLPQHAPLPYERPAAISNVGIDIAVKTASLAAAMLIVADSNLTTGGSLAPLKNGLDALSGGNIARARAMRDSLPATSLDHHILAWAIALSGGKEVPSGEIAAAARALPEWPGIASLRKNSERAMFRERPAPQVVVQAFGNTGPQTVEGTILLARSHLALGSAEVARAVLSRFWSTEKLDAKDEVAIIGEFGKVIPASVHRARMERMLYHNRIGSAERVAGLAGARELVKAWAAVIRGEKDAPKLLDAVPSNQRSSGYSYAKAKYLRRKDKFADAAAVVLEAPTDDALIADLDAWWIERRVLARELLDHGDAATAYRVAAGHAAASPANIADAEFHAGWLALRALKDPTAASRHFARIAEIAQGPISRSRAFYWLGRAAEAGGPGIAKAYYERAAACGTCFYGQLAAARLGRSTISTAFPQPTDADRAAFARREAVRAIQRLEEAGHASRADILYRELAAELTSPGELALLAVMAEKRRNHYLAVRIGKTAAQRGLEIGALAHPTGVIPASANISGAGKALAYAIARQESEFNVAAVSDAGARGLLQLLPGTAKDMARKTGLDFDQGRLTADAGYNATLGAAYLSDQLGRFSGSYVLTFAGYNAGPRRAQEWVARYGDPRGQPIEAVVDWIERIPFTETRHYVQRVMENYQVYKMRLSGRFDIVGDLVNGR